MDFSATIFVMGKKAELYDTNSKTREIEEGFGLVASLSLMDLAIKEAEK